MAASLLLLHAQGMAAFAGVLKSSAGGLRRRGEQKGERWFTLSLVGNRPHAYMRTRTLMQASRCSSRHRVAGMECGS